MGLPHNSTSRGCFSEGLSDNMKSRDVVCTIPLIDRERQFVTVDLAGSVLAELLSYIIACRVVVDQQ